MSSTLRKLVVGIAVTVAAGCSGSAPTGPAREPQEATLHEVADLVRAATGPNGKGPAKVADLDKFQSVYSRAYEAVKSGDVVVVWSAGVKGEGEIAQGGGDVIAYEKNAPTAGGWVLLTSGEVKKLTAAEFAVAPKAAKK